MGKEASEKEAIKGKVPERKVAEKHLKTYRLGEGMVII